MRLPPKAKIYEALSAVIDGRVRVIGEGEASVTSSSGDKTYKVTWEGERIASSDKASIFQGYIGYPILAVLFATGRIEYDPAVAEPLRGVRWKEINDRFKRDYDRAVEHVLAPADLETKQRLADMVEKIYDDLARLALQRKDRK